jgi:hypothetical protein
MFASALYGAITGVSVTGVTNTQAVLVYTAPNSSACTIEVSESATYSPLVHDVDGGMFTGAASDARSTSVNNGTARQAVIGQRLYQTALNSNIYSRALQAYTLHYYRITCGTDTATGTFTTANIPFGMTYQDIPQTDPTNPGITIKPTLLSDRTQTIIDPHTGALIRRVSLPSDNSASGPYMFFGGADRVCGVSLVGSPSIGYLCSFANGNGGTGVLYYIIPSTGEARYLGNNPFGLAYFKINALDSKFYMFDGTDLIQYVYTGDYALASPNAAASFSSPTTVFSGVKAAIHAFNPDFVEADFGCTTTTTIGDYVDLQCNRGGQDTFGWVAVLKISTGQLIAATRPGMNIRSRWCGTHHVDPMYDQPAMQITTHGFTGGNGMGGGPYVSMYAGGSTLAPGSTVIAVSGEPDYPLATWASAPSTHSQPYLFTDSSSAGVCAGGGSSIAYCEQRCIGAYPCVWTWVTVNGGAHDSETAPAQVGDQFHFDDGSGEYPVTIVTKTSPTSWVITPTAYSHAPGAVLSGTCNYDVEYWKFLLDPNGTDTTGANYLPDPLITGHADMTSGLMLMEHWSVRVGDLVSNIGQPWTRTISASSLFAGAFAQCYGNGCASHPSAGPVGQPWLTDYQSWDGANADSGTLAPKAGQVYQYHSGYAAATPKYFATATKVNELLSASTHGLLDISPATLGTGSGDSYKYCISNIAGECYAGSVKGDVFLNVPGTPGNCDSGDNNPCVKNFDALGNAVLQIGTSGDRSRVISGGLTGLRDVPEFPTAKALADGSYLLFTTGGANYHPPSNLFMAKLPPFTTFDAVDRSKFIASSITLTSPGGSAVKAAIKFGYAEQGGHTPTSIAWEGDSISDANAGYVTGSLQYPALTVSRLTFLTSSTNPAYSGSKIADMVSRGAATDSFFAGHSEANKVLSILIGHNDIDAGRHSAATVVADLKAYCLARKAATSGLKIIILPILPSTASGTGFNFNTVRNAANALIVADPSFYDFYVGGIAADTTIGCDSCAWDGTYYSDGTHATAAAHAILAQYMGLAVVAAVPSSTTGSYCTSRREACVANSSSAPPTDGTTDPFKYETTDTWTPIACTTTCTIVLPVLPGHIAYAKPVFYDSGGAWVSDGAVQLVGDFMGVESPAPGSVIKGTFRGRIGE